MGSGMTGLGLIWVLVLSGYGLVDEEGHTSLLDMESTLMVLDAIRDSGKEQGIKLRVRREMRDKEMQTVSIEVV